MRKLLAALVLLGGLVVIPAAPALAVCDATFPAAIPNVDQTAAFQAVVDAAPDGTTGDRTVLCFPSKAKTYRVDGQVLLLERSHLQIIGRSNVLHRTALLGDVDPSAKTEWVQQLEIQGSDDIVADHLGLTSVGDCSFDTNFEGESAVHIGGSTDVTLTGFAISGPAGDGYGITWWQNVVGQAGIPSERVNISGGTVTCVGRQGVGVTSSTYDSSVSGVVFDQLARSVLDLEMAGSSPELLIDDFLFSGNTVLDASTLNFVAGGGAGIHQDVSIIGNTAPDLHGKYGDPDSVVDRFNFVFDGNVGTAPLTHGSELLLSFKGVDGVTVTDNSQPVTPPAQATSYVLCSNITETGNSWN